MARCCQPERAIKQPNRTDSLMPSSTDASCQELPRLSNPGGYLPALTGLRAIAAFLVFLHHCNPASPDTFTHRLFAQGYIGVSIFFVLSGFLMYHGYAETYFKRESWSWRGYLQNRFARIFPLYALLLFLTVGVDALLGRPMSLVILGLNITLLKGFFEDFKFSGIAQSWSLTVEACFYLLAPLLFVALRRWGAFWLTAGLIGMGLLGWATVGQMAGRVLFGSVPFVLFYTFFGRASEFVVGMWLARRWHQSRLLRFRFATLGGVLILSGCVLWQVNVTTFSTNPICLLWSEVLAYNIALPVGIGLFFPGLLHEKSIPFRFFSQSITQVLGRSSYAFYLIHTGVVARGLRAVGVDNDGLLFGLLILIAYGLYQFVEKPLHRRFRS